MPIYEYSCRTCGETFEQWHPSMKNLLPVACPKCGAADVQRSISAPAVRSSGTGRSASDSSSGDSAGAPAKPEVFGRKELNTALHARGEKPGKE